MNSCWSHSSSKAHAMGSCGTAVTILLTELLGHGLATNNERDTILLGTLDALLGNHIAEACKRNHPDFMPQKCYTCILEIRLHSASIHSILHSIHSFSFKCTSMNSGVSLPLVSGRTITLRAKHMPWALVAHLWVTFSRRSCLVTAWLPTMKVIVSS